MFCNRGIYHNGWTAVTRHSTPWEMGAALPPLDDDVWELYDTNTDWSQAENVADKFPEKLRDLQRLFLLEADKYNVLPLDDRRAERANSDLAGRPVLVKGTTQILFSGMRRLSESSVLNMKNKSHSVSAEVNVPNNGGASGVVVAQGGEFGGWSLYFKDGHLKYCYNLFGLKHFYAESESVVSPGTHKVRMEFTYDGGGLGRGGNVQLFVDGHPDGAARVDNTVPNIFSADETTDVGIDLASPVSEDYSNGDSKFNGGISWVQLDAEIGDGEHVVSPNDRLRIAMARQ
jgi:arylsulfatase